MLERSQSIGANVASEQGLSPPLLPHPFKYQMGRRDTEAPNGFVGLQIKGKEQEWPKREMTVSCGQQIAKRV